MASPFRSPSPVADRRKPAAVNGCLTSSSSSAPANGNALRKSFSVNVLPKAPPGISKNNNTVTPANSPADYPHRVSPFKEPNASPRHFEEIKENAGETTRPSGKSVSGRSPTLPKGMKSFMAPTFSAASKASSPRKKILSERNETIASFQSPAKNSISSLNAGPKFQAMETSDPVGSMIIEDSVQMTRETSIDCMDIDQIQQISETESKPQEVSDVEVLSNFGSESSSFLAAFPDPSDDIIRPSFVQSEGSPAGMGLAEEEQSSLPPYDPKRNYLSPRPQFLRYRPNRRFDMIFPTDNEMNAEEEEGFGEHDLDKSEVSAEDEIKEIEEMHSLEQRMAAVDMCNEMGGGEIHEEVNDGKQLDEEMASVESSNSEENFCNTHSRQFEPKLNLMVEEDDEATDDDEEVEGKPSRWIKNSLLFAFILVSVSICVLASGSPGLLPSSLHNNPLAAARRSGTFYTAAMQSIKRVQGFWRNDVEGSEPDFSVKNVSGYKFEVIVNSVMSFMDSWMTKLTMLTKSAVDEYMKNSFTEVRPTNMEENSGTLGLLTDVEQDISGHILFSDILKSSVEENCFQKVEEYIQQEENSVPVSEHHSAQNSARVTDANEGHFTVDDEQRNNEEKPGVPLSSELQDEDAGFEETLLEADSEGNQSSDERSFEGENQAEISETMLVSEETQSVNEHTSESENLPEVSSPEETSVLVDRVDSQVNEASISLSFPKCNTGFETLEGVCETMDVDRTTIETRSDGGYDSHVSLQEINGGFFALNDLEATEITEPAISHIDEDRAEEPASSVTKDLKGSEVQVSTIPRRSGREHLLIGASLGSSTLVAVAAAIAAVYFAFAPKRSRKNSEDVKPRRDNEAPDDYFLTRDTLEKTYPRMRSPSSLQRKERLVHPKTSSPRVELLGEYSPAQMSTSDKNASRTKTRDDTLQTHEKRSQRRSSMSSATQQEYTLTSDYSADSPSYGSFTTYEMFMKKESTADEEQKVLKVTPVRRSSRIRKQAMSP